DELLGLVRGLLYAGAQSLLLTLWDVDDSSTAKLMKSFYRSMPQRSRAQALQAAMLEIRDEYPHPFYWAPFVLIGKVFPGRINSLPEKISIRGYIFSEFAHPYVGVLDPACR